MNTNRISVRYAKALFELALEENNAEKVNNDMQLFSEVSRNTDFRSFLENPVIFPSKKQEVFNKIFKNKVEEISLKFFKLLSINKRELFLKAIARNYNNFYRKHFGIKSVELITPFPADQKLINDVANIIATEFNTKVEMADKVDPEIIGGFIITVEWIQYDASVSTKLKDIRKEMMEATD